MSIKFCRAYGLNHEKTDQKYRIFRNYGSLKPQCTYLESEVKVWKIWAVSCLEHVTLEMHIRHLVKLKDLLLVNLFQSISVSVEFDKRDSAV